MSSEALKLFTFAVIVFGFPISVVHGDAYLDEWSGYCDAKKDLLSCAKYRALKYIANYTENSIVVNKMGPLRLMRLDDIDDGQSFFVESPRYFPGEGEFGKFLKFVQRQINYFLNHQGILISLPTGARIIEYNVGSKTDLSPRSKKKKADLLIQLITLFKVFKIKVLVALALVGIIMIKKILLAAAFILPSIIHNIKMNCKAAAMANAYHHYEESHDDHQGFHGISGFGGGYGHSGYGKEKGIFSGLGFGAQR